MGGLDRYQIPSILVILLGFGVVASGFVLVPSPGQQEHHHEVRPVSESQVEDTYYSPVVRYSELSPAGKDAFRAARHSDDGHHVVYGEGDAPPDFEYPTDTGPRLTYVEYEGSYYELETRGSSFEFFDWIPVGGLGLVGLGLAAVGSLAVRRDRPRVPATLLTIFASITVLIFIGRYIPPSSQDIFVVIGSGVVGGMVGGTWLLLGRLWK